MMMSLMISGCAHVNSTNTEKGDTYLYSITKISGTIDWNTIPVMPIDKVLWTKDYGIRAQGQLCYDDDYLYIHQSAVEQDIRAENTEPLSPVYEDSWLRMTALWQKMLRAVS